ncbi:MAG: SGNH/GDSL hydrolase family protein [Candidatus Omnitrophica bacterium]|nr:SGNH/GDSL hydrolase family protein [Candidatus Omnitrophota bacterium]
MLSKRRVWFFRIIAILIPFFFFFALEIVFRVLKLYAFNEKEYYSVTFADETKFFPQWEENIKMPKPAGVCRIFSLGGSTTEGYGIDKPFTLLIQQYLAERYPGLKLEVINGGVGAAGSYRVYNILNEACRYDPDYVVFYIGHNEFLEDIFFDKAGFFMRTVRFGAFLRRSHVINWMASFIPQANFKPKLQRHFLGDSQLPLIHSDKQYKIRLNLLRINVEKMIDRAKSKNIKCLFVPEIPNLLYPPLFSAHGAGYLKNPKEWERAFDQLNRTGSIEERIALLRLLNSMDEKYAQTHFWLGLDFLDRGELVSGKKELILANLYDMTGHKSNEDIAAVIIATCRENDTASLDLRDEFYNRLLEQRSYRRNHQEQDFLFLDHCHPTQLGHQMIARAIFNNLAGQIDREKK